MSLTELRASEEKRITTATLLEKKRAGQAITAITAYDYPTAKLIDHAGIDMVLVGDSVGMAVLGYDSTLPVTMEEMLHHTRAVSRGLQRALLVADMPYGSYHVSDEEGVRNAIRFLREAGAQAVKIEGGQRRVDLMRRLHEAEVPVMAHLGLTPQSVHKMGGYRVQAQTAEAIETLYEDAALLEAAGAFAIVLEGIPREVAEEITARSGVPTIGIGAGPACDGQILVFHDLFNLTFTPRAKFTRQYADGAAFFTEALERYRDDVTQGTFPNDAESYHLRREVREQMEAAEVTGAR